MSQLTFFADETYNKTSLEIRLILQDARELLLQRDFVSVSSRQNGHPYIQRPEDFVDLVDLQDLRTL